MNSTLMRDDYKSSGDIFNDALRIDKLEGAGQLNFAQAVSDTVYVLSEAVEQSKV